MVVISNTSPLRYLIAAGQADLLGRLFGTILIPTAVERELLDPHAPPPVRHWVAHPSAWLQIREIKSPPDEDLVSQLHLGEAETIALALELRADLVIMDERRGRQVAAARNLTVIGALGILRESFRRGLISNPVEVATQLRSTGFRASRALMKRFEEQIRELED